MRIKSYKELIVWQKSMELVVEIYKLTEKFPSEERYCLVPQMRRATIAIPSNIAEGHRRRTKKDFRQFLVIANSSAAELETQIEISKKLPKIKSLKFDKVDSLLNEILRMLNVFIRKLS